MHLDLTMIALYQMSYGGMVPATDCQARISRSRPDPAGGARLGLLSCRHSAATPSLLTALDSNQEMSGAKTRRGCQFP